MMMMIVVIIVIITTTIVVIIIIMIIIMIMTIIVIAIMTIMILIIIHMLSPNLDASCAEHTPQTMGQRTVWCKKSPRHTVVEGAAQSRTARDEFRHGPLYVGL